MRPSQSSAPRSPRRAPSGWAAGLLLWMVAAASGAPVATTEDPRPRIHPDLIGVNLWHEPEQAVWDQVAELPVHTIRIGGAEYDRNPPSPAQVLAWVERIHAVGAQPIVQVSQYRGAAEAAALVRYLNIEHHQGVKLWNVGNEPWLQAGRPPWSEVTPRVRTYLQAAAMAMKAVDPTIRIYGPDLSWASEEAFQRLLGGVDDITGPVPGQDYYYLDGVTFHSYPPQGPPETVGAESFRADIARLQGHLARANTLHGRTGDHALGWGLGEFNAATGEQVNSFGNGQMFAQVFAAAMKYGATYAATWSMFENGGTGSGSDFGLIDGQGRPRASYHHMALISRYFQGRYADGRSDHPDVVTFGAVDGPHAAVMILNRGSTRLLYELRSQDGASAGERVRLVTDTGGLLDQQGSIGPRETQVLVYDGGQRTRWRYDASDFQAGRPPRPMPSPPCDAQSPVMDPVETLTLPRTAGLARLRITGLGAAQAPSPPLRLSAESEDPGVVRVVRVRNADGAAEGAVLLRPARAGETQLWLRLRTPATTRCPSEELSQRIAVRVWAPLRVPARIEAEAYSSMVGLATEATQDVGGGQNIGWSEPGDLLEYLIEVPRTDSYRLDLRVASALATGAIEVRDGAGTTLAAIVVPDTGGWQAWQTLSVPVHLSRGTGTLRLLITGAGVNLNWIALQRSDTP